MDKRWMTVAAVALMSLCMAAQSTTAKTAKKPAAPAKTETAAAKPAGDSQGPTPEVAEAFLNRMFGYNENVTFKIISVKPTEALGMSEVTAVANTPQGQQVVKFFVTGDGGHAIMGNLMPFGADPFAKARETLAKSAFGATKGPKDSKLQIVEFADLECPACKVALPVVQKLQEDFPQAKFVFQSFPLEQLHPWAARAAQYLDCIHAQSDEAAWNFIEAVYSHQGEITNDNVKEKLDKYVALANQDPAKIAACSESPEAITHVRQSIALANEMGVNQTPTIYINGRSIQGVNPQEYDQLKAIVQFEAAQAK